MLSYTVLCHFHILSYTMYFSYTVLFHILSYCTFNCVLSSHSSAILLISCYILYAFHLHILFSFIYCTCSYTFFLYFVLSIYCHLQFFVLFIYFLILCTFNCILSSYSSVMLLISCHILYAFHLHILVIYSIHIISF